MMPAEAAGVDSIARGRKNEGNAKCNGLEGVGFFFLIYGRRKLRKIKGSNQGPRALQKWYDFSRAFGGKNLKVKMVVK